MPTRVKIPATWIHKRDDVDVNAFFAGLGYTVVRRTKSPRGVWRIRLSDNLTTPQKTSLIAAIEAQFNAVEIEDI